jgi:Histidine kinase-, DNA gyrase B-, and HSP90-like ATPase/HD domain
MLAKFSLEVTYICLTSMQPTLQSSKLVATLKERSRRDDHAAALFGIIRPIADDVTPMLEFIRYSFPSYPSHGIDHSVRVLQRIGAILSKVALKQLSNNELFFLILAVIFHDIGMVAPDSNTFNDPTVRRIHHKRSADLVRRYLEERLPLFCNPRMTGVIAFVIESHGLTWDEMEQRPEFSGRQTFNGQVVRPGILAVLLRVGDLLDLDADRISDVCLRYCSAWYTSTESLEHNNRHRHVEEFDYQPEEIKVHVKCHTESQYRIWFSWLEYLKMDILSANTYLFSGPLSAFRLPVPNVKCEPGDNATFELWPLRFEIDDSGSLWDLLSKSIYTGTFDYLRELLQNSIDACLLRIYENPDSVKSDALPRSWSLVGYDPAVVVGVSRKRSEVLVWDNGVGMNRESLERFLFRIAGSGMNAVHNVEGVKFPAIATFGIGFISVLTRVSNLRLITRRVGSNAKSGLEIELDANLRDAIVKKAPNCPVGTTVLLKVKDHKYIDDLETYLWHAFGYPSVNIRFIDWDYLDTLYASATTHRKLLPEQIEVFERVDHFRRTFRSDLAGMFNRVSQVAEALGKGVRKDRNVNSGQPPFTIYALEPEAVPTSSAWCFFLDNHGSIRSCKRIDAAFNVRNYSVMVVVPVQFRNTEVGIEWRSLHAFLFSRGISTKRIFFSGLGPEQLFYDDSSLASSEPYALLDVLSMYGREPQEMQNPDWPEWTGPMLLADRRKIQLYLDVDFETPQEWQLAPVEDFFVTATFFQGEQEPMNTLSWFIPWRESLYQDGIRLPVVIGDIAPVGTVVGVANFIGESRLPWNVSRNAIDQSEEKLQRWRSSVSTFVLGRVSEAVRGALDKLDVTYHWTDLWMAEDKESLSRLSDWLALEDAKQH